MGPVLLAVFLTLLGVLLFYAVGGKSKGRNYPRGPGGIPVFGHLFAFGRSPHKKLAEWAKEFGPVFAIEFGSFPAVVITDAKLIKAAFDDPDFIGRPAFQHLKDRSGGEIEGVTFTNGKQWQEQRRFVMRALHDFNFGKKSMEAIVHEEITEMIERWRKRVGKPISTVDRCNAAITNILWTIVTGERYKQSDPELHTAMKHFTSNFHNNNFRAPLSALVPILHKISPKLSGYTKYLNGMCPILQFLQKPIDFHRSSFQEGQPRDLIDAYLEEINKTTDTGSSFYKEKGEKALKFVVYDLLVGGAETTSTALVWALLYLAKYSKVQKKMQAEILNVVGESRLPSLDDRPKMPFTEAVIQEVLRLASVVPFGVPHLTTRDVVFEKFTIPKDTIIFPNIYGVHMDEEWGDNENFRPQRFLNKKGELKKIKYFMAFSAGNRACLGESFAKSELFLFIASLFQVFTIVPTTKEWDDLSTEGKLGCVLSPLPHELILKIRK